MARTHVQSLLSIPQVQLLGLSAPETEPSLACICERAAVPLSDDTEALLATDGLEAVVIATPTDTHSALVVQGAAARLDVFCEKPLGRTAAEAREAARACARAGVKLAVGHVVRYFPAYAGIRQAVVAGEVGPPGLAKCRRISGPPSVARSWYGDPVRSGGLLLDMGVHDFDWLRWCLGPVDRLSALTAPCGGGGVAMVTMVHRSGAISGIELSWSDPQGFATAVEVSGPAGLLRYDSRASAEFVAAQWPGDPGASPSVQIPAQPFYDNPYRRELDEALCWFGGGPAPRSSAEDAVAAVALAEAALLSAACREPVSAGEVAPEGAN